MKIHPTPGLLLIGALMAACYEPPASKSGPAVNYSAGNRVSINAANSMPVNVHTNMAQESELSGFTRHLPDGFSPPETSVERTLLREYGAVYVARGGVSVPGQIVFENEAAVSAFQSRLNISGETIGGLSMELQSAAMDDLRKAVAEARSEGFAITPRDVDSARRSYDETVGLWKSRVDPALKHWVGNGRISAAEAEKISGMTPFEQVSEILQLEEKGIFFAKDLSKSILYSVAPPGTSQHLSLLAFDVKEHENFQVRAILAKHKWFQTVVSDLPHFTYLGVHEIELPGLGLKKVASGGRVFWVPDL